ncbi:MAG: hypothetical protein ABR865_16325 [Terracidiphilus sp.]
MTIAFVVAAATLLSAASAAQTRRDSSNAPYQVKPVPADSSGASFKTKLLPRVETIAPSAFNTSPSTSAHLLEYRSENQMTAQDRDLVASAEPAIREDAALAGIEFEKGKWSYQQLVCQALPGHILLLFKGDNGAGDVSQFSAAIPLGGKGHVRIIPIQRRGFSLFSPAPVNPLTIAAFNRIRSSEPANQDADWLATALCYAALTGARPEISPLPVNPTDADLSLTFPPTIEVGSFGESTVRFVDGATGHQPMEWALAFNAKGQLLKVTNSAVPAYAVKPIPQLSAQQTSLAVTRSDASAQGSR